MTKTTDVDLTEYIAPMSDELADKIRATNPGQISSANSDINTILAADAAGAGMAQRGQDWKAPSSEPYQPPTTPSMGENPHAHTFEPPAGGFTAGDLAIKGTKTVADISGMHSYELTSVGVDLLADRPGDAEALATMQRLADGWLSGASHQVAIGKQLKRVCELAEACRAMTAELAARA